MIRSSFFNSLNGDRKYNANNFAEYFASFIGNGIFLESFDIATNENMTITVKEGKAWINGYIVINDDDYILTIANADGVLNRIDRVVLRWDSVDREIRLEVKKGAFATTPDAPVLQRDEDGYELAIFDILILAGTSKITISNLVDTRENKNLCGYVDSLIAGNVEALNQRIGSIISDLTSVDDRVEDIEDGTTIVPNADNAYSANNAIIAERAIRLATARQINGVNFDGTQNITVADNTKAPNNHASTGVSHGLCSTTLYGHAKLYTGLDRESYIAGEALSSSAGKVLNDKIINLESKKIIVVNYIDYIKGNPAIEYTFDDIILRLSTEGDGVNGRINISVKLTYNAEIMYYRQGNDFSSGFRTATANTFTAIEQFPSNGDRPVKADIYYNGKLKTLYFYVTTDGMVSFYRGNVVLA